MQYFDSWEKRSKGVNLLTIPAFDLETFPRLRCRLGNPRKAQSQWTKEWGYWSSKRLRHLYFVGQNVREEGTMERSSPRNLHKGCTWAFSWLLNFAFIQWDFMRPSNEQSLGSCKLKNDQGWEMFKSRKRIKMWLNTLGTFSRNPRNVTP